MFHNQTGMANAAPYSVNISPDQAKELAEIGGSLLLLDVPEGTVVGIDQQVRKLFISARNHKHLHSFFPQHALCLTTIPLHGNHIGGDQSSPL